MENDTFLTIFLCSENHPHLCKAYMYTAKSYNAKTVVAIMS